jgi:hypothetical protein
VVVNGKVGGGRWVDICSRVAWSVGLIWHWQAAGQKLGGE